MSRVYRKRVLIFSIYTIFWSVGGCSLQRNPVPLHLQDAYCSLGYKKGDFLVAEKCCQQLVSLPMFPELTSEQIAYVVEKIKSIVNS